MQSSNLNQIRKCCENKEDFLITYDGGSTPDLPVLVCKTCFDNFPIFQKFIKFKQLVKDTRDSKTPNSK
jgi:predicted PolB exonuclease-like 3'-5' exonuclease